MTCIVEAVDEALGLPMLVAEHPSLGVTELARRAGLTKARAFRRLTTLEHRGLIARESTAAVCKLSYNALLAGNAAREQVAWSSWWRRGCRRSARPAARM